MDPPHDPQPSKIAMRPIGSSRFAWSKCGQTVLDIKPWVPARREPGAGYAVPDRGIGGDSGEA